MAIGLTVEGDVRIRGAVIADTLVPTTGTVGDNEVKTSDPIVADKLYHRIHMPYSQNHGSASASQRKVIHVAKEAGNFGDVNAGVVVVCSGAATITVDIYNNGTTILNAPISIDSGDAAFAKVAGTFADDTYVAGDVIEVVVVATAGGGTIGQGVFLDIWADELPTT